MSFIRNLNAERQRLAPLFTAAVQADNTFHAAWDEGAAALGYQRYKNTEEYTRTLSDFHDATLAIDSRVTDAITIVKRGDLSQMPVLVAYLDLPGRYFRSGYLRRRIWRLFKRIPLGEEQATILRRIILNHIETAGPEFQEVAKVAPRIHTPDFFRDVQGKCDSDKNYISIRAKQLLARITIAASHPAV